MRVPRHEISLFGHSPHSSAFLRSTLLAAAIGVPAALAAALFLAAVHASEHGLWVVLPKALGCSSPPWYLVLALPVLGSLVVLAARALLPGDGGASPMHGLNSTPTTLSHVPGIVIAALGTLGFGAVLGPEAPVIALGSAVGVLFTRFAARDVKEAGLLPASGAFSAVSALFGGPIVAGILLVEGGIGAGAALMPRLVPGLVAAAVGYVVFDGLGSWSGLNAPGLEVPHLPAYHGTNLPDLVIGVAVGVLAALVVNACARLAIWVGLLKKRFSWQLLLIGGGLAVGALAMLGRLLGADSQDVLFSGQSSVPAVVAENSVGIVLVLLLLKVAISLGCGFRGGPIFPAIFLGVAIASVAVAGFGTSPTLAIAVGAAAGMAGQTRLLICPLVLSGLLVGPAGADAVPAAALASVAAWMTATALHRAKDSAAAPQAPAGGATAAAAPTPS